MVAVSEVVGQLDVHLLELRETFRVAVFSMIYVLTGRSCFVWERWPTSLELK